MDDPFVTRLTVPVAGGRLTVARAGPDVRRAESVVVAVHGITASHMAWQAVARALLADAGICVLAPDLRGRGRSAGLPGPHGVAAHVADLLALLDRELAKRRHIAGESYTVADITGLIAVDFMKPAKLSVPENLANVKRWHAEVSARPSAGA